MKTKSFLPYVYLVVVGILVGAIGVFIKLIGDDIHFTTLVFYRLLIGLIFLVPIMFFLDKSFVKPKKKDLFHYFLIGVLFAITFLLFTVANLFAPVTNVVLITNLAPFFVLILAYFFLHEKITKVKIVTLVIAFLGIVILNPFHVKANIFGNLIALSQGIFVAIMVVVLRKENRDHKIGALVWYFFFAMLVMLPFVFVFGWGDYAGVLPHLLFLGIFSTGVAYLLQNLALQKVEAEISSIIIMIMMPLSAIVLAWLVLNEGLSYRIILGGTLMVFAGIYLQYHSKKFRKSVAKFFGGCA